MLKFSKANAKLANLDSAKRVYSFDLPAGKTCPQAKDCKAWVVETPMGLRLVQGKDCKFRCFSASNEALFKPAHYSRKHNLALLSNCQSTREMVSLLSKSLPLNAKIVRLHVSGDFFSETYFLAWIAIANKHPNILFYAYTKSLDYWVKYINHIPPNMNLTSSYGGKLDHLIKSHKLRFCKVAFSPEQAKAEGLEIDHNDSHAAFGRESFAVLLHGHQSPNSEASAALKLMKKQGVKFSYTRE